MKKCYFSIICICLLFLLGLLFIGCKTKQETYVILIERDQTCNEPKHKKAIIRTNMFEKQFHRADSIFMAKLREVSEQAAKLTDEQLKINQR